MKKGFNHKGTKTQSEQTQRNALSYSQTITIPWHVSLLREKCVVLQIAGVPLSVVVADELCRFPERAGLEV